MEEGRENLSKSDSEGGAGDGEMGSRTVVRETDGGRGHTSVLADLGCF